MLPSDVDPNADDRYATERLIEDLETRLAYCNRRIDELEAQNAAWSERYWSLCQKLNEVIRGS